MSEHDEFLASSIEAVRRSGDGGLDALGWWEMLGDLDDPDMRAAVFSVFRAQGRELVSTAALSGIMAAQYLGDGAAARRTAVALARRRGGVATFCVVGPLDRDQVLVDLPGRGLALVPMDAAELVAVEIPGRLDLHELRIDTEALAVEVADDEVAPRRARALAIGRMALAMEMIGASEAALALAVDYAKVRQQFGRPIGSFQALRHLLAWAQAECAVMTQAAELAVRVHGAGPADLDVVVKALVGRNARRVCERTLQSFGGIGFTREHDHHFHSRVLALDALCGSSAELTRLLGRQWRAGGVDLAIPRALLAATAR